MSKWMKLETTRHQVAIAGQVSNRETKQAIPGVRIELTQGPETFKTRLALQKLQYGDRWQALTKRLDLTYSATDGCFYFLDLPEVKSGDDLYTLTVSLPDAGTRYAESVTQTVTVSSQNGQLQRAMVDIALPSTALTGQIKTNDKPIQMANVRLVGSNESTFSDAQGMYLLSGIEASTSTTNLRNVNVLAQGYEPTSQSVYIERGKITTLDITLK
jgi:hypothetical protein